MPAPDPGGPLDYGFITDAVAAAIGRIAAPIRLQHGYAHPKGFGYGHIDSNENRRKQILGLGYPTVKHFVWDVAQNYESVREGHDDSLVLVRPKDGYDLRIVVRQAEQDGVVFWGTVTAIPSRISREAELYKVVRTGGREPTPGVAERLRFATLSLPKKPI